MSFAVGEHKLSVAICYLEPMYFLIGISRYKNLIKDLLFFNQIPPERCHCGKDLFPASKDQNKAYGTCYYQKGSCWQW